MPSWINDYWDKLVLGIGGLFGAYKYWSQRKQRAILEAGANFQTVGDISENFTKRIAGFALKIGELTEEISKVKTNNAELRSELQDSRRQCKELEDEQKQQRAVLVVVANLMEQMVIECECSDAPSLSPLREQLRNIVGPK